MILPKGNPLIELITLPFPDINIMLNNLEQQDFTGYVKLDLFKAQGAIFFSHGTMIQSMELDDASVKVHPLARILNKVKKREVPTSSYVLSAQIAGVLASLYTFQSLYLDYEVKKKELKKVLSTLEGDSYTGIIEVISSKGTFFLILDRGKLVTDHFAKEYGSIVCGVDTVQRHTERISNEGAKINVFAEKQSEIEIKKRIMEEEMEKIKQLIVRVEKGFFSSGDVFKIDEYVTRESGIRAGSTFQMELETSEGVIFSVKAAPGKKLGGYIATPATVLKKLKLREGDLVSVKPVR